MQINQFLNTASSFTVEDWLDIDKNLGAGVWQSQKMDLDILVGGIFTEYPEVLTNIYNHDGALTGDRTVDLATYKLMFLNGNVYAGTTGATGGAFRLEVIKSGAGGGIYVNSGGVAGHFIGTNVAGTFFSTSGLGLFSVAVRNVFRDDGNTSVPTDVPSSMIEVISTGKGVRLFPRMPTSNKDSIVTPADYLEIVDETRERKEVYRPFWGWHPVGSIMPDWGYEINDENVNTNTIFSNVGTNGGVAASTTNAALSPLVLWGVSTGPNANGEFRHATSNYYLGSVGKKHFKNKISVNALSTITDRYAAQIGYSSTNSGIANADGMFFLYDEGGIFSTTTASANWLCVCRNGGVYSVVDSGVLVTTTSSALQTLEIKDYGTGAKVEFFINGVIVATITANIPDNTKQLYILERIVKTIGTTARTLFVDYTFAKEKFNTPR